MSAATVPFGRRHLVHRPVWGVVVFVVWCMLSSMGSAQGYLTPPPPPEADLTIHGGLTMPVGEVVVSGALGWPGFWADVTFAPTARVAVGVRFNVDYGAVVGLDAGLGGAVSVPIRIQLYRQGRSALGLLISPRFGVGEGAYLGQHGEFGDDFGTLYGGELGLRYTAWASRTTALTVGLEAGGALLSVPAAGTLDGLGHLSTMAAAELVMNRSTMLFATVHIGGALHPAALFDGPLLLRAAFGMSYRL